LLVSLLLLFLAVIAVAQDDLWLDSDGASLRQRVDEQAALAADLERATAREAIGAVRQARVGKEPLARAGQWRSRRFDPDTRGWQVQLERDIATGEIKGLIQVNGSRTLAAAARIEGRIEGAAVNGVILDESGTELGFFSGAAREDGMAGTYETLDGDEGEWSYEEFRPEVVLERRAGR
jgi:hypothetical protein